MTAKQVFLFYIVISLAAAQYYISDSTHETLFGYGSLVDIDSLISATKILLVGLVAFLLGAYVCRYFFKAVDDPQSSDVNSATAPGQRRSGLPLWQGFSLAGITLIYAYLFVSAVLDNGLPENLTERVFENKLSAFFMVALAYLGYAATLYKNTLLARGIILAISLFVVVIDGSRSGLIPLFGLLFGALLRRRVLAAAFLSYMVFFGASYSITARLLNDRFGFDVLYSYLVPEQELVIEALRFIFDYAFAFSILHFSYMSFVAMPDFSWQQLLTSINPLPAYFLDPDVVDSLRFEQRNRAIGGPAELLIVGPVVFCVGFFLLGALATYADTVIKSRFRFIVALMFLIATIVFFQYSLRTSARMFTAIVLVVFLLRRGLKIANTRAQAS